MKKTVATAQELGLDLKVPVEMIRRKRQKYLRIRVKPDCVQVSGPHGVRLRDMKAFVREKTGWVYQQWNKLNAQDQQYREKLKRREDQLLWMGDWKPIQRKPKNAQSKLAILRRKGSQFEFAYSKGQELTPELKKSFYRKQAKRIIPPRVREIAKQHKFEVGRIYIRDQKTKWGSCSSKANISLNWRLICCPEAVIDYLIIHECCHLIHMNHSERFWSLVEELCPDYKQQEQWLRKHEGLLFRLP